MPPDGSLHIIKATFRGAKNGSSDYFDCAVVAVWRRWRSVLGHGGRLGTWSHWPDRPRHCGCLSALWVPWQTGSAPLALSRRSNRHCLMQRAQRPSLRRGVTTEAILSCPGGSESKKGKQPGRIPSEFNALATTGAK